MNAPTSITITPVRVADLLAARARPRAGLARARARAVATPHRLRSTAPALSGAPGFRALILVFFHKVLHRSAPRESAKSAACLGVPVLEQALRIE